jgi:archaeal flagellin FlaB
MNLIRKGHGHAHRGVIGVESAIVMIAFVIVAAALAFVVLNMGFSTTQKAKTTIISSLGEASSSLEVAGKVIGSARIADARLNVTAIPIKIASGGESVNLSPTTASIKYVSNSKSYDDIYTGALTTGTYASLQAATLAAQAAGHITTDPFVTGHPTSTAAFIYWSVNRNNNAILDQGEHAVIAIAYMSSDRPTSLDNIRTEIVLPTGATLTVERQVPNVTNTVVDLG